MFSKHWWSGFVVGAALVGGVALWYRAQVRTSQTEKDKAASFYDDMIKEMQDEWADVPIERKLKVYASMAEDGMLDHEEE